MQEIIHLQTDWRFIGCRKREQDLSKIYSTRAGSEVTCPKCIKFNSAECQRATTPANRGN